MSETKETKVTRKRASPKPKAEVVAVESPEDMVAQAMVSVGKALDMQYKPQKLQAMSQATIETMISLGYRKVS